MLNKDYILKRMEPYLNAKRELSEFEFSFLFSQLSKQEQYEVINIMIANGIDYVDEKIEEQAGATLEPWALADGYSTVPPSASCTGSQGL